MPHRVKETFAFLSEVLYEFHRDNAPSIAASLAFYTVFSLAPLLLIVIVVAGWFVTPEQAGEAVHGQFSGLVGVAGADQVRAMVVHVQSNPAGSAWARVLGIIAVVLGSNGVMLELQSGLNRVWKVKPDPRRGGVRTFLLKRLLSFAMVLSLAFLLLVSLVVTAVLTGLASQVSRWLPAGMSWVSAEAVNFGISLFVITVLFAAIYKVMPEARIRWRDVALGALGTGLLFTLGKAVIGMYLGNTNIGSAYGTASSLAIVLAWVYYSTVILMLGAEVTQVWTRRYGGGIRPEVGAVIVLQEEHEIRPAAADAVVINATPSK